jgi:hypothetical protein
MADLKSPWNDPVTPIPEFGGEGVVSRGTDPNVTIGSGSGLSGVAFDKAIVSTPGGEETNNSLSGLPAQPNRFEPSGTPPQPPSLQDRMPGTIDER